MFSLCILFKEPSIILFSKSFEIILIIILLFSAIINDSPRFKFFISICSFWFRSILFDKFNMFSSSKLKIHLILELFIIVFPIVTDFQVITYLKYLVL